MAGRISGLSGENPEMIYRWSNHGVIIHGVSALQADEEGRIKLIYSDSENGNYLCLEPTTEEVAVCEITMGVGAGDMNSYKWVVAEFNKRYPTAVIQRRQPLDITVVRSVFLQDLSLL